MYNKIPSSVSIFPQVLSLSLTLCILPPLFFHSPPLFSSHYPCLPISPPYPLLFSTQSDAFSLLSASEICLPYPLSSSSLSLPVPPPPLTQPARVWLCTGDSENVCERTHTCMLVCVCVYASRCVRVCVYTCVWVYVCIYASAFVGVNVYLYVCACVHASVFVCVYIYI
ncbi:unnamed protein product [Gadus morhua 'NCC']